MAERMKVLMLISFKASAAFFGVVAVCFQTMVATD